MTVHAKTSPVGIDERILVIQNAIFDNVWTDATVDVYGRLYITEKGEAKIAEAYTSNGEYKEIFFDDRTDAVFGFFVDENRDGSFIIRSKVQLVCSCRLDKIYGNTERRDEEAVLTVLNVVQNLVSGNNVQIKTTLPNVFSKITFSRFKYKDMQPWLNFSIEFDINYKNKIC